MDIKERLRRKAQNEQTSLELAELLRLDRLELDRLRRDFDIEIEVNGVLRRELAEAQRDAARYRHTLTMIRPYVYGIENIKAIDAAMHAP